MGVTLIERIVLNSSVQLPFIITPIDRLKRIKSIAPIDKSFFILSNLFVTDRITIIDIGANIGQSSVAFKKIFPNSKIIAFEGNPYLYKLLKELLNTKVIHKVYDKFLSK